MNVIVLVNLKAGTRAVQGNDPRAVIARTLAALGVAADMRYVTNRDLVGAVQKAAAAAPGAIIVGGGDGTISAAAGVLAGGEIPLGVLALGTLNHFAKDLGIPLDLEKALGVVAGGRVATVDVGRVNDHIFINNSSLGVYPRAVLERDAHRDRFGLGKWAAMALAVVNVFRRLRRITVRLETPDGAVDRTTPLVLVSNNHYCVTMPNLGTRSRMDEGRLSLYVANTQTRWGMAKLAARALLGRLEQARDFEVVSASHFTIASRRSQMRVALDGEVRRLPMPLEYRIWPEALRVFVPGENCEAGAQIAQTSEPKAK